MNLRIAPFIVFLFLFGGLMSQETEIIAGTVSFVTSNNVYVKIDNTDVVAIGAILSLNGTECLKVTDKSSTSLVCTPINDCAPAQGDTVQHQYAVAIEEEIEPPSEEIEEEDDPNPKVPQVTPKEPESKSMYRESIRGRITLSNYNTSSSIRENRNRFRTRFTMDANHIGDSKFSVQTHLAYRNINNTSDRGRDNIFNVYNLNVRFDATPTLSATAGRFINPKASSIGAVDGLLVEKYFGNFYVGGLGGFRPDFQDYGFNSDLLQYGGYVGVETSTDDFMSQTTLGAIEQTNAGATDRRYLYFQHSSTISRNFNLFSSAELDIFSESGGSSRLTNLYISGRYRFSRAANVMVSYDSRKQIIYYETFDTDIDRLLAEDLARQGIRVRFNARPHKLVWAGISYSRRFQSNDENKSDNFYIYATLSRIPSIGGRFNVSYNNNATNYLKSSIYSARYSREFFKNKLSTDFYYRMADYAYENENLDDLLMHYVGATLSYRIARTWQISVSGEYATNDVENTYRFNTRLTKRFSSKKKK